MSLANLTVKASYQGDGSNDTFAIPFDPIRNDSTETYVYVRDESVDPATQTLQVEGALNDYVLADAPDSESFDTNVVFKFGNIPTANQKVIIIRVTPLTQTLQLTSAGYVPLAAIEKNFDAIVAMIQEINEKLTRVPLLRVTEQISEAGMELPEPGASKVIGWNAAGTALRAYSSTELLGATDEVVQDIVGSMSVDTATVNVTYNDGANTISWDVIPGAIDHNALLNTHNLTTDINHNTITNAHNLTTDINHNALTNYDANKHIDHTAVSVSAGAGLTGGGTIAANRTLAVDIPGQTTVTGATGDLVMIADVSDSNNIKKIPLSDIVALTPAGYSDEQAQDAIGAMILDTASVDLAYVDGTPSLSATVLPAGVDHDALANFVANEHIDHTAVSMNTAANSGLAGGGTIAASRSLTLDVSNLTADTPVAADFIPFNDISGGDTNKATITTLSTVIDHDTTTNFVANEHIDHTAVSISAGAGLTGGGTIAANRTLSVDLNGLTTDTPATADFIPFYDFSGSDSNKSTIANMQVAFWQTVPNVAHVKTDGTGTHATIVAANADASVVAILAYPGTHTIDNSAGFITLSKSLYGIGGKNRCTITRSTNSNPCLRVTANAAQIVGVGFTGGSGGDEFFLEIQTPTIFTQAIFSDIQLAAGLNGIKVRTGNGVTLEKITGFTMNLAIQVGDASSSFAPVVVIRNCAIASFATAGIRIYECARVDVIASEIVSGTTSGATAIDILSTNTGQVNSTGVIMQQSFNNVVANGSGSYVSSADTFAAYTTAAVVSTSGTCTVVMNGSTISYNPPVDANFDFTLSSGTTLKGYWFDAYIGELINAGDSRSYRNTPNLKWAFMFGGNT
jgi:hypothetical protein